MKDEYVEDLCKCLVSNPKVERLELDHNQLTEECLKSVAELVSKNRIIKHLSMEGNTMSDEQSDEGMTMLCSALFENQSLMFLNLANNGLTERSGSKLLAVLEQNPTLIALHLQGNNLNFKTVRAIQDLLMRNLKTFQAQRQTECLEREEMAKNQKLTVDIEAKLGESVAQMESLKQQAQQKQRICEALFVQKLDDEVVEDEKAMAEMDRQFNGRLVKKKKRPDATV